jgi:uncharacterized membrane protein YcaP (DUF421 family)
VRGLMLPADVWLAYVLGAVLTGAIVLRWPSSFAVLPPVIVLAAVAVVATAREYIATSSSIHREFIRISSRSLSSK